eukprot:jgi/Tetstr1/454911/TSEL_041775.t1
MQAASGLFGQHADAPEAARSIITLPRPRPSLLAVSCATLADGTSGSYPDDFLFLADSHEATMELRVRLDTMLDRLGMPRNPNKGVWEPTQVGPHLGLIVD